MGGKVNVFYQYTKNGTDLLMQASFTLEHILGMMWLVMKS